MVQSYNQGLNITFGSYGCFYASGSIAPHLKNGFCCAENCYLTYFDLSSTLIFDSVVVFWFRTSP